MEVGALCKKYEAEVIRLRRKIHENPELSLAEKETSTLVMETLAAHGIPCERVGDYNVVGVIGKGESGKSIALRADMDALPIREQTKLPFASKKEGIMHACGHDAHTAMLLGAACALKELEPSISGKIYLCFQMAEEMHSGAQQIVPYLIEKGGVDQAIGLHVWPKAKLGKLLLLKDRCMASCIGYHVDFHGTGGHGSRPDLVRDPVKAACELVLKFSEIPGNFYDITDPAVVSTGFVKAGSVGNVFPSSAFIEGSCRYFKMGGEKELIAVMERMVEGVAKTYGVEGKMEIWPPYLPVVNTPALVERGREIAGEVEGLCASDESNLIMASENFSEFLKEFPGFFGLLGCGTEDAETCHDLHSDQFDLDERAMRMGSEFFVRYAYSYVKEQ